MELVKIIKYLDKKFNEKIAAKWDNVGLQQLSSKPVVDLDLDVTKVVICLDLNQEALNFAVEQQAQLIITRHPFLFGEDLEVERKQKKDMIKTLVKNEMVVYSIHTNYDASANQNLLALLETKFAINKTKRIGEDNEGYELRLKAPISSKDFIKNLQSLFPTKLSQINRQFDFDQKVKSFYIVSGAGGSTMINEELKDCYFVTGEIKWNEAVYANNHHVSTLLLGHYMENYFVDQIQELLTNNFSELKVFSFDIQNQVQNWT